MTQCVGLNSWWHFFAISLVFSSHHQHLTHPEPCIPLCVCHASENSPNLPPILNLLPLTYYNVHILRRQGDLLLWRVAGHLNPECDLALKMLHWRYAAAIQKLRNWRKFYLLINKAIHGVTEINTMLKIENWVPRTWPNVKSHNLISGIKSEDTYGYVPDYTQPLTCNGCHIGFTLIRSDRVCLNILLDNKNPWYRHWNRLPMLLGSKTTGHLIFWRLCLFILNRVIIKMING